MSFPRLSDSQQDLTVEVLCDITVTLALDTASGWPDRG